MNQNLPKYLMIEGQPHLMRDTFSMGVINTNTTGLEIAKKRREAVLQQRTRDEHQKIEINNLRKEVTEIKAMLLQLLEKVK